MIKENEYKPFIQYLFKIGILYGQIRDIVTFSEAYNRKLEASLSVINELRNSFDHIMRCVMEKGETYDIELFKLECHLYRAGYDAYEITAMEAIYRITTDMGRYDPDTITTVMPEYYREIKPLMTVVEKDLSNSRSEKTISYDDEEEKSAFSKYDNCVTQLVGMADTVSIKIPSLEEVQQKKEQKLQEDEMAKNKIEKDNRRRETCRHRQNMTAIIITIIIALFAIFASIYSNEIKAAFTPKTETKSNISTEIKSKIK